MSNESLIDSFAIAAKADAKEREAYTAWFNKFFGVGAKIPMYVMDATIAAWQARAAINPHSAEAQQPSEDVSKKQENLSTSGKCVKELPQTLSKKSFEAWCDTHNIESMSSPSPEVYGTAYEVWKKLQQREITDNDGCPVDHRLFEQITDDMESTYGKNSKNTKFHDINDMRGYIHSFLGHYLARLPKGESGKYYAFDNCHQHDDNYSSQCKQCTQIEGQS